MGEVATDIVAHDRASAVLNKVSQKLGIFNKQGLAMGVAFAGITMGINAAMGALQKFNQWVGESVQKFYEFEKAMAEVSTLLDQTTRQQLPEMTHEIDAMSQIFAKSAVDLARGLYQVVSAGVDATKATQVLYESAKLAAAGLTSVETAVDAVTTVMNAYHMSADHAHMVTNVLMKAVEKGKQRIDDLANALGYVVPIAAQAAISFQEVAAAIATLTQQGINSHKAARGLRQVISSLISPSEDTKKAMIELGVYVDELTIEAEGLSGTLNRLYDATGGSAEKFSDIFQNVMAFSTALALTGDQATTFADILGYMSDEFDKLQDAFEEIQTTSGFAKKQMEEFGNSLDRALGKAASDFDQAGANVVNWAKAFVLAGFSVSGAMDKIDQNEALVNVTDKIEMFKSAAAAMSSHLEDLFNTMTDKERLMDKLAAGIEKFQKQATDLRAQREILKQTHQYQVDLRYITLGLKDASYASKINDATTQNLVNTIREANQQIEELNKKNTEYSIQSQKNQLEMLKIQQAASGRRGRLTREEKDRLKELQDADTELRIKMLENQIEISETKQDISPYQKQLDAIKAFNNEQIYLTQNTYQRELDALNNNIKEKELAIARYREDWDKAHDEFLDAQEEYYGELEKIDKTWSEDQKKFLEADLVMWQTSNKAKQDDAIAAANKVAEAWKNAARGKTTKPTTTSIIGDALKNLAKMTFPLAGFFQTGTPFVPQTGLYVLHRGERVIPARENTGGIRHGKVDIKITATLRNNETLEEFGNKIGQAIAAGYISGISSEFEVG